MNCSKQRLSQIVDKYLVLRDIKRENWNCQQLVLRLVDFDALELGKQTSLKYRYELVKTILMRMLEEAVDPIFNSTTEEHLCLDSIDELNRRKV